MVTFLYGLVFLGTLTAFFYMFIRDYKNIDVHHYSILIIALLVNLGFFIKSMTTSVGEAILLNDIIYLNGTILPALFIVSMLKSFNINAPKWAKFLLFAAAIAHLVLVWVGCTNDMYYANPRIEFTPNGTVLHFEKGPWMVYHFVYIGIACSIALWLCIYGLLHSEKISRWVLACYVTIFFVAAIAYGIEVVLKVDNEFMPVIYMLGTWVVVFSYGYTRMHNVDGIVSTMYDGLTDRGYVAFDKKGRFLNANKKALSILPELNKIRVDRHLVPEDGKIYNLFTEGMKSISNGTSKSELLKVNDIIYKYDVSYFNIEVGKKQDGFLFEFVDDTERQKHMEFMEHYNDMLQKRVREKSQHITEIQQKIVLGLSEIIENRDSNTGGHVRRTSDIVKILVKTVQDIGKITLDSEFIDDVIRAAPMHDLGKIAVDNSILCKPARLTDEEYAVMKTHAIKSAEIVHSILEGVEEEHFVKLSSNLAKHHHERWDGKGYPEGLSGEKIPLEARIMALADVYDALVSKRCYKEPMSFEEARKIILENMGTQFDPNLREIFEKSCNQLENYYKNLQQ